MIFHKAIKFLLRKYIKKKPYEVYEIIKLFRELYNKEKKRELLLNLQSIGYNVHIDDENWHISSPEFVILGNGVHIGDNVYFETEGGLIIGDDTYISNGVTITTIEGRLLNYSNKALSTVKKPVFIGKNVQIGMNVSINAGVKIGNGAKIGGGSVIKKDVKSHETVNFAGNKELTGINNIDTKKYYPSYFDIPSSKICFVLSTGRCGSKSIASNFNKHRDIEAYHENIMQFVRLSTEYAHGSKTKQEVKSEVINIFETKTIQNDQTKLILHSDQRYWNMVPIFRELFPQAQFIHLVRDGRDTVRSMYARNWFAKNDFRINQKQWAEYRLNGHSVGDVSLQTWNNWSAFERCCWYWNYINEHIDSELSKEPFTYLVRLEDIATKFSDLLSFLHVENRGYKFEKFNSVKKRNLDKYQFEWTRKKEKIFQNIAGGMQSKLYSNGS